MIEDGVGEIDRVILQDFNYFRLREILLFNFNDYLTVSYDILVYFTIKGKEQQMFL